MIERLTERLGLRLRFALFFAALGLGGAALIAGALVFGYSRAGGPPDGYVIAGLIGAAVTTDTDRHMTLVWRGS